MSIFSGWTEQELSILWETITGSPAGLMLFAGFGLVVLLIAGLVSVYASGKVAGFFAKVRQEDEEQRLAEEENLKRHGEMTGAEAPDVDKEDKQ